MDLQTEAPPGCGAGSVYSHRNRRADNTVQSAVTPSMTQIGISMLSVPMPKNVFFIIVNPCVSGKKPTGFCVKPGGQLVKEHKLRLRNQCQHNKKALPFTARKTCVNISFNIISCTKTDFTEYGAYLSFGPDL